MKIALTSKVYDVDDFAAAQEFYHSNGWTDGLPVVPPTEDAVAACLEWALMPPDMLIGIEPVRAQPITAEKLAINAVMAGCLPMHFPIVATAWQAMMKEEFLMHGVTSSTGGAAVLVIINGPIRREIGANSTFNTLGNSDRATAVIGRALRLALINLLDARPGSIDRSTLGHPGKFSYCIAEDEEDTTWQPLSVMRGIPEDLSAVTVMGAMAPRQIMNEWTKDPREILETFAAEMRANQRHYSIYGGNYAIIIPKQLRDHIQDAGWTKRDIAEFIYERARIRRADPGRLDHRAGAKARAAPGAGIGERLAPRPKLVEIARRIAAHVVLRPPNRVQATLRCRRWKAGQEPNESRKRTRDYLARDWPGAGLLRCRRQ